MIKLYSFWHPRCMLLQDYGSGCISRCIEKAFNFSLLIYWKGSSVSNSKFPPTTDWYSEVSHCSLLCDYYLQGSQLSRLLSIIKFCIVLSLIVCLIFVRMSIGSCTLWKMRELKLILVITLLIREIQQLGKLDLSARLCVDLMSDLLKSVRHFSSFPNYFIFLSV